MFIYKDYDVERVRLVTTTDTATPADKWLRLSGNSLTATPYSATGNEGRSLNYIHAGTSLTQLYTIAGIGVMVTAGEILNLKVINGAWAIVGHTAVTDWIDMGVLTIGATTTAPTKASGITIDKQWLKRVGGEWWVRNEYAQSNNTSAVAGSGDYKWRMPTGAQIDVAKLTAYTTVIGGPAVARATNNVGTVTGNLGTASAHGNVLVFDADWVRYYVNVVPDTVGMISSSAGFSVTQTTFSMSAEFRVPGLGLIV